MKRIFFGLALGCLLSGAPPLRVAGVVRDGMPPFEATERLYRLEGEGCLVLKVAEQVSLRRAGEARGLGRLEVTAVKDGYALARVSQAGQTYPLKGDLVVRHEQLQSLPPFPASQALALPGPALAPKLVKLSVPPSPRKGGLHRGTIFFLKGNAELSPGARAKLQAWATAWTFEGRWVIQVPENPEVLPALSQARAEALKGELAKLGLSQVECRTLPPEVAAKYDSVYISKEPW